MNKVYYTIEENIDCDHKPKGYFTVWKNVITENGRGFSCKGIFSNPKRSICVKYCKDNDIKVSRKVLW